MIKIEKTNVYGWEAAIRGARNPMNSWNKSDSTFEYAYGAMHTFKMGDNDLKLMKSLSEAGSDHAKYLRMITVTCDITAPLYWFKEYDTYKVGTVANSTSTMHRIHAKEFTVDDFSHEHLYGIDEDTTLLSFDSKTSPKPFNSCSMGCLEFIVAMLNHYREQFLECTVSKYATAEEAAKKKKDYWWQMIQLLPSSYNQKRTVLLNYQVLKNIYFARRNHKLDEWHDFCDWIETLPYSEIIIGEKK